MTHGCGEKQLTWKGDRLQAFAPAKINIYLLIAGKRDDGFHEIDTLMAKIDLCDRLTLTPADRFDLVCTGKYVVEAGPENLVAKAASIVADEAGLSQLPVSIELEKNIPPGSGLGGGSSDAAAAMMAINEFLGLNIPIDRLRTLSGDIGSDIPFFFGPAMAISRGRGEKIENFSHPFDFSAILLLPDISVSTKEVYVNYRHDQQVYERLKERVNAAFEKKMFELKTDLCANMLEYSCFELHKRLADLKSRAEAMGHRFCLSGSGAAMFMIAPDRKYLESAQKSIKQKFGCECIIVNSNRW